ncbi:3-deoxy-D-manno-octulosonic acid transferase [Pedobacter sp. Hv1]|uniref:3-deoxy-D-manno-octulosonic acid transferase n=1 Tax=Pedobacter sp. Hv1 TaxID=1740090 RepID=UPI0006D8C978|nr:glycosyltransferase N-terminal domain-containing protein [Pedobacter sp. Hv1]KQB99708.1 3-deoxy-D-manno-octulosonic acid transferase [Pedobacter sp. Hv1]
MLWIYNIGIAMYGLLLRFASLFNAKAKLFVEGRQHIFEKIAQKLNPDDQPVWFHFASLGEFEQGRPVLEKLKAADPQQKIVVTFFSPSGYEIRKNYALADVFYLPLDTAANAKKFIDIVNPKLTIFTKYEFWFHYFKALHTRAIPLYLISGIFRPHQAFFKGYGGFYRGILKFVTHFFVQNEESLALLKDIGINQVSLSGDTRFDRVYENAKHPKKLPEIEAFCEGSPIFIAGSTWPEDEKLLVALTAKYPDWKFIIAPHEIGPSHIQEIESLFPQAIKFSVFSSQFAADQAQSQKLKAQSLIIDNIGMLSSLYQYAKVAYIGGGFGAGIHNTLEAAAFGLPVIFGPKYDKFQEAKDLISIGAAKSINTSGELLEATAHFIANEKAATAAQNYVNEKKGATEMIINTLHQH